MTLPASRAPADRLLQGLQGLVLHLHAIAGDLPAEEPARAALERCLSSAEELVEQGCAEGVAQASHGTPGTVETLLGLVVMGPPMPGERRPLRLRVQVGQAPRRLRPGVQQALGRLACDQARLARLDAGAGRVEVQMNATWDALTLRVRDDGCWPAVAFAGAAELASRSACAALGAQLRIWRWPGRGGEWQLRLPALLAYDTDSSTGGGTAFRGA